MVNKKGLFHKNKTLFISVLTLLLAIVILWVLAADTFVSPSANGTNLTGSVVLNCTFDSLADVVNVSFYYNGSNLIATDFNGTQPDTEFNITWDTTSGVPDGTYDLYCNATNSSGGTTSIVRSSITVDNTAPSVTGITVNDDENGANLTNGTYVLNVTVTDASSGVDAVFFNLTNSSGEVQTYNTTQDGNYFTNSSFDTSSFADGNFNITVYANDTAGNLNNSEFITLTVDTTEPSLTLNSPANNSNMTSSGTPLNISTADSGTGIENSIYELGCDDTVYNFTNNVLFYPFNKSNSCVGDEGSELITVISVDYAGNENETTYRFNIDDVGPQQFNISSPTDGQQFVGLAELNWTEISDGFLNISNFGYYLDSNDLVILGDSSNATNNFTTIDISTGTHTIKFWANDTVGNSANRTTITFSVNRQENVTVRTSEIQTSAGTAMTGISLKNSSGDALSDDQWLNITLSFEFTINTSTDAANDVTVVLPSFTGTDANWNKTDKIKLEVNASSTDGITAGTRSGTSLTRFVLFKNMSLFLSTSYYNNVSITFNQSLLDLDVLYIDDDAGNTVYKASQCTGNSAPSSVTTASVACYVNTSTNVTLYAPHFSGGGLANDTAAPTVNITNPVNNTVKNNSYFTFSFDVWEANPKENLCWYNLTNSTQDQIAEGTATSSSPASRTGVKYTYQLGDTFLSLLNDNYNITVNCTDLNNRSTQIYHNFTVADTTAPRVTSVGPSGALSTSSTSLSVTLYVVTDEAATCKYSSLDVLYSDSSMTTMTAASGNNHTASKSYTADDSSEIYYFRCNDTAGNVMSASNSTSYTVDVGTTTTTTTGGGGGGSGITATTTVSKKWDKMTVGENTMTISSTAIALTEVKVKVKGEVEGPEITATKLGTKPSAVTNLTENVYQYLQMTKNTLLKDDNIENVTFTFEVTKTWFTNNNLNEDTVVMKRWGTTWNDLPTTKKSTSTNSITYEAISAGLSYFAVTAEKLANITDITLEVLENVTNVSEEVTLEEPGEEVVEEEEAGIEKPINWAFWIILIVIIVFAGVMGYVFYTQKKGFGEEKVEKKEAKKEKEEEKKEEKKEEEKEIEKEEEKEIKKEEKEEEKKEEGEEEKEEEKKEE